MRVNEAGDRVLINEQSDYVVLRNGLEYGIALLRMHEGRHPSIGDIDIEQLDQEHRAMPFTVSKEAFPFELTPLQARIAICGIMRAPKMPESPASRRSRQVIGARLSKLLKAE